MLTATYKLVGLPELWADVRGKLAALHSQNGTHTYLAQCLGVSQRTLRYWQAGQCLPDAIHYRRLTDLYEIAIGRQTETATRERKND